LVLLLLLLFWCWSTTDAIMMALHVKSPVRGV
jgi:hypothetical protein